MKNHPCKGGLGEMFPPNSPPVDFALADRNFTATLNRRRSFIYYRIYQHVTSNMYADDIFQSVSIRLLYAFRQGGYSFSSNTQEMNFIQLLVRNEFISHQRKKRIRMNDDRPSSVEPVTPENSFPFFEKELHADFLANINDIPEHLLELLSFKEHTNFSQKAISVVTGVNQNTINSRNSDLKKFHYLITRG